MTRKTAQDPKDLTPPDVTTVEGSIERTQKLLAEFRRDVARLLDRVQRDVERLREATLGELGPVTEDDRFEREEAREERRIAEAIDEEQAMLRTRSLVHDVVNERFQNLNELIKQAKVRQSVGPLQNQRLGASRRRR